MRIRTRWCVPDRSDWSRSSSATVTIACPLDHGRPKAAKLRPFSLKSRRVGYWTASESRPCQGGVISDTPRLLIGPSLSVSQVPSTGVPCPVPSRRIALSSDSSTCCSRRCSARLSPWRHATAPTARAGTAAMAASTASRRVPRTLTRSSRGGNPRRAPSRAVRASQGGQVSSGGSRCGHRQRSTCPRSGHPTRARAIRCG